MSSCWRQCRIRICGVSVDQYNRVLSSQLQAVLEQRRYAYTGYPTGCWAGEFHDEAELSGNNVSPIMNVDPIINSTPETNVRQLYDEPESHPSGDTQPAKCFKSKRN